MGRRRGVGVTRHAYAGGDMNTLFSDLPLPGITRAAGTTLPAVVPPTDKYQLPEAARAAILGMVPPGSSDVIGGTVSREAIEPPVNCRVSIGSIVALLEVLKSNEQARSAIDGVRCELNIPGPLAQLISNELTGIIVDRKEVPAILQIELAKLH